MISTQTAYPWRAVARTLFQAVVGLAALVATIAVTDSTPAALTTAVAVSATVTRVMAIPAVADWISAFLPFLAAAPPSRDGK